LLGLTNPNDLIVLPNDSASADKNDIKLAIQDSQTDLLDTAAAGAATAADILAQLSSLEVNVKVDLGTTDINGNPNTDTSAFLFSYDKTAVAGKEWTVDGNAAALGTAQKDQGASLDNLLAEADTITWTAVGSTASKVINNAGPDLTAVAGTKMYSSSLPALT
jgi:hypothetical protein